MKILKKNQLIILVLSLMLVTAGYINFVNNNTNSSIETSGNIERDDNTLGDATLVSSNAINENIILANPEENEIVITPEEVTKETVAEEKDYYFTNSKLERSSMYSELLEIYQEIYNNNTANAEEKSDAWKQINKINSTKNSIMIAESLILAKGFEDIVIFVNDESISVIVKAKELLPEQIAQIQNIISRELAIEVTQIHISTK